MSFVYHPTSFLDAKVSLFKNVKSKTPLKTITFRDWIFCKDEDLIEKVQNIRSENCPKKRKVLKEQIQCITGSGVITNTRSDDNLKEHNGYILIDIDYKDNLHLKDEFYKLKEKVFEEIDAVCYAGLSVSGEGYYLIIKIEKPERHKEYFEFIKEWIKYGEDINIDKSCRDVGRLRLFSVDNSPYINKKPTALRESFLREAKKPSTKIQHSNTDIDKLVKKIETSRVSIAPEYMDYIKLAIVFANELGENGREYFHRVCSLDSKYDSKHCDKTFTDILNKKYTKCSVGTLIYYMQEHNII
jgi:hypothetical protein